MRWSQRSQGLSRGTCYTSRVPLNDRVLALKNIDIPKTKNGPLGALAAYNYYRQRIKNFAQLSAELYGMSSIPLYNSNCQFIYKIACWFSSGAQWRAKS